MDRQYDHEISVCTECRTRRYLNLSPFYASCFHLLTSSINLATCARKTEWDSTDIVIRFSGSKGSSDSKARPNKPIATYSRTNGARQSRRLRQIKEYGERRKIIVKKSTTVKEMKIMVSFGFLRLCEQIGLTVQ